MTDRAWSNLHQHYDSQDWIDKPSLFAQDAVKYFPKGAHILELGAGQGQDSRFFADSGFTVELTDLEPSAIERAEAKFTPDQKDRIKVKQLDLREPMKIRPESFDVVYAHLSLHYFDMGATRRILSDIATALKPGGVLAFFVNSTSDPENGQGKQLEDDFFQIDAVTKRYFDVATVRRLTSNNFDVNLLDNHGETYKDAAKGVHNLIRFVGTKKARPATTLAVPFVGGIIERTQNGQKELLIQTRWKPQHDPVYSGTLEFPAGVLDKPYESVYDALAREIQEEAGLTLKNIRNDSRTPEMDSGKDDSIVGFRPFCCTQQLKNGKPWVGMIFLCEVEPGKEPRPQETETKDVKWMPYDDVKRMFNEQPNQFFGLELPAWRYYFGG